MKKFEWRYTKEKDKYREWYILSKIKILCNFVFEVWSKWENLGMRIRRITYLDPPIFFLPIFFLNYIKIKYNL